MKKPAIIIIQGDKFYDGSKDDKVYEALMLDYASQGYVALSVDYRLFREARIPACIEDVKCAVRWLKANAEKYNVNTNRIGAYGHSAGGAMALMLALSSDNKELEGDGPILYLTGGNDDVAYGNACGDYDYITKTPVVHMYDPSVGHGGTYGSSNGGGYGKLALLWLDWQLKDKTTNSKYFLTEKSSAYPNCVVKYKNF